MIRTPVAFALTKPDLFQRISGLVYGGSALDKEADRCRRYDRAGCEALNRELKQSIRDWESSELVVKAENNFARHQSFALSARLAAATGYGVGSSGDAVPRGRPAVVAVVAVLGAR